jgi:hypothetical protein
MSAVTQYKGIGFDDRRGHNCQEALSGLFLSLAFLQSNSTALIPLLQFNYSTFPISVIREFWTLQLFGIITDWATLSLVGSGMGMLVVDLMFIYPFRSSLQDEQFFSDSDQLVTLALDTMLVGGIAFGVGRIIQALLPVSYGARFNRNLRNTLGLTRKMEDRFSLDIGLVPATTMDHSLRMGVQFAARVDW